MKHLRIKVLRSISLLAAVVTMLTFAASVSATNVQASDKPVITLELSTNASSVAPVKLTADVTSTSSLSAIKYTSGKHKAGYFTSPKYLSKIKDMAISSPTEATRSFKLKKNITYTFYAVNLDGSYAVKSIKVSNITKEDRAVWVSFLEFSKNGYTEADFEKHIDDMFDTIKSDNFTTVYAVVRPFSDAMYPSKYFPYSMYCSGKQGNDPGFDPLAYMVQAAKNRDLKIFAYINPYRICSKADFKNLYQGDGTASENVLSGDNVNPASPAWSWLNDDNTSNDRNVLYFNGNYYYNPAVPDVRELITDGVKEIVKNYDVDGIIFDDYFYPSLGSKYKNNFDYKEYDAYVKECTDEGQTPEFNNIVDWRKNNVNELVSGVYKAVKAQNSNLEFGVSPAGNLSNLRNKQAYYVDIDKWCSEDGYIDFVSPQQYWGFDQSVCGFEKNVQAWMDVVTNDNVKLYITLPMHDAEAKPTAEWRQNDDVLARMVQSIRQKESKIDGFSMFRYNFLTDPYLKSSGAQTERDNVLAEFSK